MATHDNGLFAALLGPSEVTAKVGPNGQQVTLREETEYPFDGKIRVTVHAERPVDFPMYLRIPAWATGAKARIGDQEQVAHAGTVLAFKRQWRPGDVVELDLPMRLRVEERFRRSVAIQRGPLFFALRIGCEYRECTWRMPATPEGQLWAKPVRERSGFPLFDWEIYPSTPWNYALVIDREHPEQSITVARHPIGKMPFAGKAEPGVVKIPDGDVTRVERALFKAEVSQVLPHPAEADLRHDGKPWPLIAGAGRQWVGFERSTSHQEEPIILKVKARRVPLWKMQQGKNWASGRMADAMADATPESPVSTSEPEVEVELVPYGCTRLRVAEFPVAGRPPSAPTTTRRRKRACWTWET